MKKLIFAFLLVVSATTNAMATDKNALAKDLMKVLGIDSMLESARQESITIAKGQMESIITQLRQANPNITDTVMKEFNTAAQEFSDRITNSWDSSEAARIYSSALVEGLSENDIRAAIDHYRTPAGQIELKVINAAAQRMQGYISANIQKETVAAMKEFIAQLRSIAERMKNKKDKSQSLPSN